MSADLTGRVNHIAATIGADIVKQKMAENNGGYKAVNFGYTDERVYSKLTSDNPIDWCVTNWRTAIWAAPG